MKICWFKPSMKLSILLINWSEPDMMDWDTRKCIQSEEKNQNDHYFYCIVIECAEKWLPNNRNQENNICLLINLAYVNNQEHTFTYGANYSKWILNGMINNIIISSFELKFNIRLAIIVHKNEHFFPSNITVSNHLI